MKYNFFTQPATGSLLLIFFVVAFVIRATLFYAYIQHEQRYYQPDTLSYTMPAQALYWGKGFVNPNGMAVFWRTPGYPLFLAPFYTLSPSSSWQFEHHEAAYKAALWIQILFCSLLPIFFYFLALFLTRSLSLAYMLATIGTLHPGSVLASTFLLTDGPAQLFFVLFLMGIFKNFRFKQDSRHQYLYLAGAALALSIYTWMRPMGQFVGLATIIILFFSHFSVREKIKQALFFITLFALSLSPWFVRNYQLTGKIFFCPLFGLYFNVFNAPKIRARIENIPHELAWKKQCYEAEQEIISEYKKQNGKIGLPVIVNEIICMRPALPWIMGHPHYFALDWIIEVCKTTFDLYMYQCVALYNNIFKWDPLVEYLPEKLAATLWTMPLPWGARILAYIELISELILWIGIFAGLFGLFFQHWRRRFFSLWIPCGIMIGAVVCQTGGFGYARLRLPIEPLILILGIIFWLALYQTYCKKIE